MRSAARAGQPDFDARSMAQALRVGVHALITERGVRTRHALAHALAQELFERDRRRVGYLAGIGIFRAWYLAGAERLLDEMNGRAILIDPPR